MGQHDPRVDGVTVLLPGPLSTMSSCDSPALDLSPTFGPFLLGFTFSSILFGVTVVQAYIYYKNNKDAWYMNLFVSLMVGLDIAETAVLTQTLYHYLIRNFGNQAALTLVTIPFIWEEILFLTIIVLSQLFYESRVFIASNTHGYGRTVAVIISIGSIISFSVGIASVYEIIRTPHTFLVLSQPKYKRLLSVVNFSDVALDIMATTAMTLFLSSYRTSFKSTKAVLDSLLFFSINRGFLICLVQILNISLFLALPLEGYWIFFHLTVPRLHINTLLAMLNSRFSLRSQLEGRVNVIGGTSLASSGHCLPPIRLHSDPNSNAGISSMSVGKNPPLAPTYHMRSEDGAKPSMTVCDDIPSHSGSHAIVGSRASSIA